MMERHVPIEVKPLIGTKQQLGGYLFNRSQDLTFEEYDVLDWKFGTSKIVNMKTLETMHPTFHLLVKNEKMKKSRWTMAFPCRSIRLKEEDL